MISSPDTESTKVVLNLKMISIIKVRSIRESNVFASNEFKISGSKHIESGIVTA
jgi:hypothetical protein